MVLSLLDVECNIHENVPINFYICVLFSPSSHSLMRV